MQRLISASNCSAAAEQRQRALGSSIPTQMGIARTTRTLVCAGRETVVYLNRSAKVGGIEMCCRRTSEEDTVRMNVRSGCACHLCRDADLGLLEDGNDRRIRVRELHVDEGDETAFDELLGCDDVDGDDDCNSDDLPDIRPLGRKVTNGSASAKRGPAPKNRRNKKMDDDTGRSDGEDDRNLWSVGDTIALVRAKRVQYMYITGMGTSFARIKTREWKWEDVQVRLQTMDITREGVDCGKKWDNLMQQFKKVHKFQNLSGGKDYFKLASKARRSEGFNFVMMDRSVYDEMEAMTKGDHTIHLKNLADTGAVGEVQMPAGAGAGGETMASEGGGEAADEEQGSTKDSTFILNLG
ncbi:hypothetical protein CBR_g40015 [Chara braunii]|uniref:Myb/SANT-like DNA-binding domain-containing protein n=1 Tax=Chara braunii TaxID=69332 RepID=A0A388LT35_CHABU|nr:hypothetical protein CBR_g40015 [Chara braunii]|eukprot:GBG85372.1 hypothetical protein CBR_g40015 [Chara braunii]